MCRYTAVHAHMQKLGGNLRDLNAGVSHPLTCTCKYYMYSHAYIHIHEYVLASIFMNMYLQVHIRHMDLLVPRLGGIIMRGQISAKYRNYATNYASIIHGPKAQLC